MQQLLAQAHEVVDRMVTKLQFQFEPGVRAVVQKENIHATFSNFISYSVRDVVVENVSLKPVNDIAIDVREITRATIAFKDSLSNPPHLLLRIDDFNPLLEYQLVRIGCQEERVGHPTWTRTYDFKEFIQSITTDTGHGYATAEIENRADRFDIPRTQKASSLHLREQMATLVIQKHINAAIVHVFTLTFSAEITG